MRPDVTVPICPALSEAYETGLTVLVRTAAALDVTASEPPAGLEE